MEGAGVFAFPGDARLNIRPLDFGQGRNGSNPVVPGALTDAEGRYVLDGVPTGEALLLVANRRGIGRSAPLDDVWIPSPGLRVERDLQLARWPRLLVRWQGPLQKGSDRLELQLIPDRKGRTYPVPLQSLGSGDFQRETVRPGRWIVRAVSFSQFLT